MEFKADEKKQSHNQLSDDKLEELRALAENLASTYNLNPNKVQCSPAALARITCCAEATALASL